MKNEKASDKNWFIDESIISYIFIEYKIIDLEYNKKIKQGWLQKYERNMYCLNILKYMYAINPNL